MMQTDDLKRLVKFDPDQVREAIQKCMQTAQALEHERQAALALADVYRNLLRTHGYSEDDLHHGAEAKEPRAGQFSEMKIADAAFMVLSQAGPMHGKQILKAIQDGGRKMNSRNPMATLATAMRRDSRIIKVPRKRNIWRANTQTV